MKRIFFFSSLTALLVQIPMAFGGDSFYYEQRLRLGQNSKQVLIKHGLCADDNDCVKKTLVLTGGTSSGVIISLYDIRDSSAIKEIIGLCMDEYEKNEKRMSIIVEVYREKHEDVMGPISSLLTSPYIKLYVQGEK